MPDLAVQSSHFSPQRGLRARLAGSELHVPLPAQGLQVGSVARGGEHVALTWHHGALGLRTLTRAGECEVLARAPPLQLPLEVHSKSTLGPLTWRLWRWSESCPAAFHAVWRLSPYDCTGLVDLACRAPDDTLTLAKQAPLPLVWLALERPPDSGLAWRPGAPPGPVSVLPMVGLSRSRWLAHCLRKLPVAPLTCEGLDLVLDLVDDDARVAAWRASGPLSVHAASLLLEPPNGLRVTAVLLDEVSALSHPAAAALLDSIHVARRQVDFSTCGGTIGSTLSDVRRALSEARWPRRPAPPVLKFPPPPWAGEPGILEPVLSAQALEVERAQMDLLTTVRHDEAVRSGAATFYQLLYPVRGTVVVHWRGDHIKHLEAIGAGGRELPRLAREVCASLLLHRR